MNVFRGPLALRRAREHTADDSGVVAVLVALCMVALMGFAALAVDGGSLYVQRTQMQKAVDAAALAGAYDIGLNSSSAGDATTYAAKNGVASGELLVNQFAATFAANDSWTVTATRQVNLAFAPFLGINKGTIAVSATAINSPAKSFDSSYLMPYAVWGGNKLGGSDPLGLNVGDQAILRINGYQDANVLPDPNSNPNWQINDEAFKGYFHDFSGIITQGSSVTANSKGGNACGQEPVGTLQSLAASGTPGIFPVIGTATGGGGDNNFTILGFVALKIGSTSCGGGQMDGHVMNWTTWNAQPGGPKVPGLPSVTVLKLWQ